MDTQTDKAVKPNTCGECSHMGKLIDPRGFLLGYFCDKKNKETEFYYRTQNCRIAVKRDN